MALQNRFKILLAEKETRDGRSYSYRNIHDLTGIAPRTLTEYANNRVSRFDEKTLESLCDFFECEPGNLIVRIPDHAT